MIEKIPLVRRPFKNREVTHERNLTIHSLSSHISAVVRFVFLSNFFSSLPPILAVERVLGLLAMVLYIKRAVSPHAVINNIARQLLM